MKFYFIYGIIVLFRIIIHSNTQPGYIHPDEFFQTIEITAGDVLKYDILEPWEFDTAMPVRSKAIIELFLNIPLTLYLRLKQILSQVGINIPFDLLMFCRLCTTLCSLIVDYSIYVGCLHFRINYKLALFLHSISYVSMVFLSRTFSNVWETQLLSLFVIVMMKIRGEIASELFQGVIVAVGMFCRPTFLIFVSPLVFMRVVHLDWRGAFRYGLNGLIGFLSVATVLIGFDTIKYGGSRAVSIGDIIVTPLNFIKYNSNATNLEQHGRHPWFLHALVNVPLLLGPLVVPIIAALGVVRRCYKQLLISFLVPVVLLSLFPHQEMRFLLPIYPTAILLAAAAAMKSRSSTRLLLVHHVLFNLLSIVFWGYLHQGALLGAASLIQRHISTATRSPASSNVCHAIVTYKSLMLPKFPLAIERDSSRACNHSVHNLVGRIEESQFWQRVARIKQQMASPAVLHLVISVPSCAGVSSRLVLVPRSPLERFSIPFCWFPPSLCTRTKIFHPGRLLIDRCKIGSISCSIELTSNSQSSPIATNLASCATFPLVSRVHLITLFFFCHPRSLHSINRSNTLFTLFSEHFFFTFSDDALLPSVRNRQASTSNTFHSRSQINN